MQLTAEGVLEDNTAEPVKGAAVSSLGASAVGLEPWGEGLGPVPPSTTALIKIGHPTPN